MLEASVGDAVGRCDRIYKAPKFKEPPYLASDPTPSELQLPVTISVTRNTENSTSLPWPAVNFAEEDIEHGFQIDTVRSRSNQDDSGTCDDLPRS